MGSIRVMLSNGHGIDTNIPCNGLHPGVGLFFNISYRYSKAVCIMTDKVDCAIWIWDNELQRKKRIRLQTLLNRVNHTLRDENQTYFALEKDRDKFAKDCRS